MPVWVSDLDNGSVLITITEPHRAVAEQVTAGVRPGQTREAAALTSMRLSLGISAEVANAVP